MGNSRTLLVALASTALMAATGAAQAQQWVGKAGGVYYQTHSKTSGIQGIGVPEGADAESGNATTLILVLERRFTANLGAELVVGIPPKITSKGTGSVAYLGDDVLSAKNVSPTLLVNYYFGDAAATWRPYLGAGINYTHFTDIRSKLASQVEMSDSWGPAVQVGLNYSMDRRWGFFASIARVDVKSDVVATGATVLTTTIDFRPITYSLGAWYTF